MKRWMLWLLAIVICALFVVSALWAQPTAQGTTVLGIPIPQGFNPAFLGIFALGMILHYARKVVAKFGTSGLWVNLTGNFVAWFFNQYHKTLLATASVAILAILHTWFGTTSLATFTWDSILASLSAGYIGDSAFNSGTLVNYSTPKSDAPSAVTPILPTRTK